eukprot:6202783-Pleurochrysis_carterae.AAC.2
MSESNFAVAVRIMASRCIVAMTRALACERMRSEPAPCVSEATRGHVERALLDVRRRLVAVACAAAVRTRVAIRTAHGWREKAHFKRTPNRSYLKGARDYVESSPKQLTDCVQVEASAASRLEPGRQRSVCKNDLIYVGSTIFTMEISQLLKSTIVGAAGVDRSRSTF